jgi:5-methylcytosine-specific restriction endonuclease McrBC regulatory subunit McrC
MERIFERYVTGTVQEPLSGGYSVEVQPNYTVTPPATGQPDLSIRPDVVVRNVERPVLVVDAKWKRSRGSPLIVEDVYQVLAYLTSLGVQTGMLIYPDRRDRHWEYPLVHAGKRLLIRTTRITGTREDCNRSRRRLQRALRRVVST